MAFNPSPKVRAAADVANEFEKEKVVILMINESEGTIEYASYGNGRKECKEAGELAEFLFDETMKRYAENL